MTEAILGLVIFGIVVTLYIDYQADKRFKILAGHLDPLIARVAKIETDIEDVKQTVKDHHFYYGHPEDD